MSDKATTIDAAYLADEAERLHDSIDDALARSIDVLQTVCDRGDDDEIKRAAFLVSELRRVQMIVATATGRKLL
jgi:DNA-binding MurR/RpiR family transcriptional regulator